MADSHALIIREVDPQPVRYLLRAPRGEPFTVRPVWLAQPLPRRGAWTSHDASVLVADHPSQAVFHVLAKARIAHEQSAPRSEEHTSELQARGQLVCRLRLEKKIKTGMRQKR